MAATHATNSIHSVHDLVRLLKSSADPPSTPGPSKIELACLAWSDPSFRATNKSEVIGEWILASLAQAKKTKRGRVASDPVADSRYWLLLGDVLTSSPSTSTRPIKTWLLPLVNRFQLSSVVIELLALPRILASARAALSVLWPLVEKKIGIDVLEECLRAVFDACVDWEHIDDDLVWIYLAVVGAYRNALANAGNKKKLYNSFLTTQLSSWLCASCITPSSEGPSSIKQLHDSIYAAGTDTLFSLDALKQPLDTLFDALSLSLSEFPISSLPPVLPKIFTSFLSATHKHRSALFVSAAGIIGAKEEIRRRGMEFVGRCWSLIWDSTSLREEFEGDKWKSVVGIFEVTEKERLFVSPSIRGSHTDVTSGEYQGEMALNEARDKAVEMLVNASSKEQVMFSMQLLGILVRVDYDFVGPVLERVISALINIPLPISHSVVASSSEFLAHVLEYHTKTRTMHAYVSALFGAVVAGTTFSGSLSVTRNFPLVHHLPALARALRTSITPAQTAPLANAVLQAVENVWKAFKDADQEEERVIKKRKVSHGKDSREDRSVSAQAQAFLFTCRISGTVLSNLPPNAYTTDGEFSLESLWSGIGTLGWTIVWECLRKWIGMVGDHGLEKGRVSKKRRHAAETGSLNAIYPCIVASAALRLLYDVRARVSFPLGDSDRLGEAQIGMMLDVARDDASDSELILEIIRTLLWHLWYTYNRESQIQMDKQSVFNVTFNVLTAHLSPNSTWSGVSATLTRDNLGLAVLYILVDRWIDVLDALASTENLEKFISLFLAVPLDPPDEGPQEKNNDVCMRQGHAIITLRGILLDLFRNAQFWELHNIRAVFISSLLTSSERLASPVYGVKSPLTMEATRAELAPACDVYRILRYTPSEYLTRPVRAELVKRAMAADVQICKILEDTNGCINEANQKDANENSTGHQKSHGEELDDWSLRLTFVRAFLQRMGNVNNVTSAFVIHLFHPPSCISSPSKALTSVTLDLIQSHVMSLIHSQELEAAVSITSVIYTLITARPFSQPTSQETWTHIIVQSSTVRLIERLTSGIDPVSLPDQVKRALQSLLEALESALSVSLERDSLEQLPSERINALSSSLSLTRWLGLNSRTAAIPFGLKLATSAIRNNSSVNLDSEACSSILKLLFEEMWCMADTSHHVHLDVLVSFYSINGYDRVPDFEHTTDVCVARVSKKLSVKDFSYLLNVLSESIGGSGLRADQRERLIHLSKVMLHDAPQGTLKIIQNFTTQCFNLFADRADIYGGPSHLKTQCLEFIAKHCSDRPAAVRSVDLGSIWSLLNKTLSGSSEHDATTTLPIFHHIVAIVGALVRLRRDLVVHTLPHLSLVLRQLMMLIRKMRPQLGAKQSKLVADTFPSWLFPSQPLSTDEARTLARLITSLTTKTVPRTHTRSASTTDSQKAESLAKPFAKHASYVLVAFVDAFNDPLCIVDTEMRRELEPGLFALCEMVGEHSRDALMASALDSGGKMIMKSLWREYEKQRYVGKG